MKLNEMTRDELLKLKAQLEFDIGILDSQQMAIKIAANSVYGATGSAYFRYFDPRITEAITSTGQLVIRTSERVINKVVNNLLGTSDIDYVVTIDTDSCYVRLGDIFDKIPNGHQLPELKKVEILDKIAKDKIVPALSEAFEQLAANLGCPDNRIFMKREGIASKSLHTAKKRYAQRVLNNEGVMLPKPKLKVMGIESVRSTTPQVCRDLISDCIMIILSKGEKEAQAFIKEKRDWFNTLTPEQVASPRSANNLNQFEDARTVYKTKSAHGTTTPKHVRAALLYNHYLKQFAVHREYESVYSGDKIKFVALKLPNPIYENVIGFVDVLPKEFGLHKYVDYDEQWKVAFLDPITRLLTAAGWDVEERNTLFSFA